MSGILSATRSRAIAGNSLPPPAAIGEFSVQGIIGAGAMGVVYDGIHEQTGQRVAIKTVGVRRPDLLQSLRREIHVLRRLRHPGVVRILAEGVNEGVPWYAMEKLEGETLLSRVREDWRRDPVSSPQGPAHASEWEMATVLTVVARIAETLEYIHEEGVVHGDLKPENIFIGPTDRPVLVDFGLAWRIPGSLGREFLEHLAALSGTPLYMAPEKIMGEPIDARADLYALGCILFELLTGTTPFAAEDGSEVLRRHLLANPRRASDLNRDVPPELDDLVLGLLAKRPRDRIGHADDVIAALVRLGVPAEPHWSRASTSAYLFRPSLVGRKDVIRGLLAGADRAREGIGGCALVMGESGIGKTYVVREFLRGLSSTILVATSSCTPLGDAGTRVPGEPLQPLRALLRLVADRCLAGGEEACARLVGSRANVLALYEPALAHLVGTPSGSGAGTSSAEGTNREEHLACIAETLEALSREQPIVLVIDDLQWADELTLLFLRTWADGWLEASRSCWSRPTEATRRRPRSRNSALFATCSAFRSRVSAEPKCGR